MHWIALFFTITRISAIRLQYQKIFDELILISSFFICVLQRYKGKRLSVKYTLRKALVAQAHHLQARQRGHRKLFVVKGLVAVIRRHAGGHQVFEVKLRVVQQV